jgi:hypothetical protein
MATPKNLNATEATVLRAIQSYFDSNPRETKMPFSDLIVALDGRLVAGKVKPIVEQLIHLGCLWRSTQNTLELTAVGISSLDAVKFPNENSFSHFCDLLLVALADHDKRIKGRQLEFDAFDLRELAKLYELSFSDEWIPRSGELFEHRNWAKVKRFSELEEGGIIAAALTGPGLFEAERLRKEILERGIIPPTYPPLDNVESVKTSTVPSAGTAPTFISSDLEAGSSVKAVSIPAADRIVRLDDNAPGRREAIENLERIEAALDSGSNELNLTADERIVVLSETRSLRERLADGRVRLGALAQAIAPNGFLILIASTLAQESIVNAASIAISAIKTLLQVFI